MLRNWDCDVCAVFDRLSCHALLFFLRGEQIDL